MLVMAKGKRPKRRPLLTPAQILAFRESRNLTQEDAAALVGVSVTTWSYWENGKRNASPQSCKLIQKLSAEPRK